MRTEEEIKDALQAWLDIRDDPITGLYCVNQVITAYKWVLQEPGEE